MSTASEALYDCAFSVQEHMATLEEKLDAAQEGGYADELLFLALRNVQKDLSKAFEAVPSLKRGEE